jgi:rhomboid protease GluP
MAIGFTPKHIIDHPLGDLSGAQFLALAMAAVREQEWELIYISPTGLVAYSDNGMFSQNAEIKVKISDNIAQITSSSTGSEMIDFGRNKKYVNAFLKEVETLRSQYTHEALDNEYAALVSQMDIQEEDLMQRPPESTSDQVKGFLSIFVPQPGYTITPLLINLNILIFVIMVFSGVHFISPDSESLLRWGANFKPATLGGQPWRLLTCCFLHIGVFHLLMNMYALLFIGMLLEPLMGKSRFLTAYLLTGILSSLTSLWWHDNTVSAGASGAIFGMYGVVLALLTTSLADPGKRSSLLSSIAVFVGYNLLYGLKGGIDNAAHIGGLLSGIVIGYAFVPSIKKPQSAQLRTATIALLTVFTLGFSFTVYSKLPNDIAKYMAGMERFGALESQALEVFSLPDNTSESEISNKLNAGIDNWQKSLQLLDSLQKLDLSKDIKERNTHMHTYCELRLKSFNLLRSSLGENGEQYESEIINTNNQIDSLLKAIK